MVKGGFLYIIWGGLIFLFSGFGTNFFKFFAQKKKLSGYFLWRGLLASVLLVKKTFRGQKKIWGDGGFEFFFKRFLLEKQIKTFRFWGKNCYFFPPFNFVFIFIFPFFL